MKINFETAFKYILDYEGFYSNHIEDNGGETLFGVSRRYHSGWGGWCKFDDVKTESLKNSQNYIFGLIEDDLLTFYKEEFWDKIRADELPSGVDILVFDMAVNMGVSRASKLLQRVVFEKDDGIIGNQTLSAVSVRYPTSLIKDLTKDRILYYISINQKTFLSGWVNRSLDCYCLADEVFLESGHIN